MIISSSEFTNGMSDEESFHENNFNGMSDEESFHENPTDPVGPQDTV